MMIFAFQRFSEAKKKFFLSIDKHQNVKKRTISNEIEYGSVQDPLSVYRSESNETFFISELLNIINNENFIIAPRQGIKPISILSDEFFKEQAFPFLLYQFKFGCKAALHWANTCLWNI